MTMAPTQAERDLAQYRAGQISLEELAARWAKRKMGSEPERPTTLTEVYEQADNKDYFAPGTWGEIRLMRLSGRLSAAEYRTVSRAADPSRPSAQMVKLFSTPSPSAVPIDQSIANLEPGSVTASFNENQPRDDKGQFASTGGADQSWIKPGTAVTKADNPSQYGVISGVRPDGTPVVVWGYGHGYMGVESAESIQPRADAPVPTTPTADAADRIGVPRPSDDELKALLVYSQGGSDQINKALGANRGLSPSDQQTVTHLDSLLAQPSARVIDSITVERGVAGSSQFGTIGSKVGQEITEPRYVSTSASHDDADRYRASAGRAAGKTSARVFYDLQPGDRALPLDRVINIDRTRAQGLSGLPQATFDHVYSTATSDEILLPRGQSYQMINDQIGRDGVREVFLSPVRSEPGAVVADGWDDAMHPRGNDGKFAPGDGGDEIKVPAESSGRLAGQAAEGGFSYQPFTDTEPKNGYMVALTGATTKVEVGQSPEATAKAIVGYLDQHQAMFTKDPNLYLGGWVHEGVLWVEPTRNVADRADAVQLGQDTDQIAVWDVANGTEIPTGGTGGTGTVAAAGVLPATSGLGVDDVRSETGLGARAGGRDPSPGRRTDRGADRAVTADAGTFDEDLHPRDEHGKFEGSGGGDTESAAHEPIVGTPEFEFAVNEWLGGTSYAEDVRDGVKVLGPEGGPVADKVSEQSRALLQSAIEQDGKPTTGEIYRGVGLSRNDVSDLISSMKDGSSITLPVSSFSPRADNAIPYAEESAQALEDIGVNSEAVILSAPAGTQAIDISSQGEKAWGEPEFITAGQFAVTSVVDPQRSDSGFWEIGLKPGGK